MEEIMLSVIVPTYNHQDYIAQALDSIYRQKTKYTYEVLVGEDCSTDNTRDILKKYEKEHPDFLTVFYREENMSKSELYNSLDLKLRSKGKYLILLEGDDYWICEDKIQKQIDFLEEHLEYVAIAHNCKVVDENSKELKEEYPECKHEEYTLDDFKNNIFPGQSTTIMMRNYYRNPYCDFSIMYKKLSPGDQLNIFVLINAGRIYCLQEKMSAYRHVTSKGDSYSAKYKYDFWHREEWNRELLFYALRINKMDAIRCAEDKYLETLTRGLRIGELSIINFVKLFKNIKYKSLVIKSYIANRKRLKGKRLK